MPVTVKQLWLFLVVMVIVRCSQSFSISVIPDGEAESPSLPLKRETRSTRGKSELAANFTPEELQIILQNRERLLQLLQKPPATTENPDDGYFAFPRQGRAMSFYFPRMGRSGDDSNTDSCCEGLRSVFTLGKGSFDICQPMQDCCPGLEQRTKIIKNYVLTECVTSEKLEGIRELINED